MSKPSYLFAGLISLLLATILVHSSDLMFGVNTAKEFYFFGVLVLIICYSLPHIITKRKGEINLNVCDIMIFCFLTWCFIRQPHPFSASSESMKIAAYLFLYFLIKFSINGSLKKKHLLLQNSTVIIVIVFFIIAIIEIIFGLLQLYNISPSFNNNFNVTGTTSNPAIFSMFLAAVFPIALSWYLLTPPKENDKYMQIAKILSILTMIMTLSIIPLIMIRAAWIGIIGSSIISICYCKRRIVKQIFKWKRKIYILIFSIPIIIIGLVCLYNLKSQSAFGRLLIWEITLNEIKEKPLLGIGYKQYQVEYNNWQAKYFTDTTRAVEKKNVADNVEFAYNEYLQILAETGTIGLLLFVLIILYTIKRVSYKLNIYKRAGMEDSIEFRLIISVFSCSISILLMALISYPLQILPIKILLIICFGALSSNLGNDNSANIKYLNLQHNLSVKVALACFLVSISIMAFSQIYKISSYSRWKKAVVEYNNKNYSLSTGIYDTIYPRMSDNGLFLLYYGTTLIANDDHLKGICILEEAKKHISDPIIYIKIGDCKKKLNAYTEAEANYLFASTMIPNRLYPKYLLALLYIESQQYDKASKYANEIIATKVKIPSTAIFEMKQIMSDFMQKYEIQNPLEMSD